MKIILDIKFKCNCKISLVIYFILFSSFTSAVIRQGQVTLFRVLLPLSIIIIYKQSKKYFFQMITVLTSLILFAFIQRFFFRTQLITVDNNYILRLFYFLFWYFCIIILFFLIKCLAFIEADNFQDNFILFVSQYIKICIVYFFIHIFLFNNIYYEFNIMGNINNFSASLVAILPMFLFEFIKTKSFRPLLWIVLIFYILFKCDAKASILAALFQVILVIGIFLKDFKYQFKILFVIFTFIIFYMLILSGKLNPLIDFVIEGGKRIYTNQMYLNSMSEGSISVRVNIIIFLINNIFKNFIFGIGIGNTGYAIPVFLNIPTDHHLNIVSSHTWLLELFLDLGLIIIIPYFLLIILSIKIYLKNNFLNIFDKYSVVFLLSFPILSLSASGLYTDYFILSLFVFSVINVLNNNEFIETKRFVHSKVCCIKSKLFKIISGGH